MSPRARRRSAQRLLPIFAALLALIYRRSRRLYVEHLIFSLHIHTLVFVVLAVALLVPWDWFTLVIWAGLHVYLFLALRRVYEQGPGKTLLKLVLLLSAYNVVLAIAMTVILLGSLSLNAWSSTHPGTIDWLI